MIQEVPLASLTGGMQAWLLWVEFTTVSPRVRILDNSLTLWRFGTGMKIRGADGQSGHWMHQGQVLELWLREVVARFMAQNTVIWVRINYLKIMDYWTCPLDSFGLADPIKH